ncbi:hypothetical protein LSTR_LSTR004139 [Laodelphax striatellus]|uniref:APAF-1 helical domain-containing protein n=1 Tax=Laodelphax striatellus TaxID=195883 RepID=A0A482WHQ2_LAOST|nr:hypothetical protein LSTR_LSTR004139 [Laodelphax striatellus]
MQNAADNEKLLKELKEFVKHYGHILYHSDDIDIIQLGLQQNESSAIFESAKALALKQPDKIFLNFQPKHGFVDSNSDSLSFNKLKDVTVACFSDQLNYAFLAKSDGSILKKRLDGIFTEQTPDDVFLTNIKKGIVLLTLSPNKRYLLSVCQDLEFRVWDLEVEDQRFNYNNGTLKNGDQSPSPPLKQKSFSPIFQNPSALQNLKATFIAPESDWHKRPLTCLKFSPNSKFIVSCSDDKMWNIEEELGPNGGLITASFRKKREAHLASVARCCAFSLDGSTVLVGCDNKMLLTQSAVSDSGFPEKKFMFDSAIRCLHTVKGVNGAHPALEGYSDFVLVLSKMVKVIRVKNSYLQDSKARKVATNEDYEVLCSWSFQKSHENFVTRSWVPESGGFLAMTTSTHCVSLYNLANGHLQREYTYEPGQEVIGIDLFTQEKTSYMLVLCQNEALHREKLELSPNEQASKFCVAPLWGGDQEPTVVVPCISGCKVVEGEDSRWLDLKANVTSCHIDHNGSLIVIGTDCGIVFMYNLDTDEKNTILKFKDCHKNPSLVVLVRIFVVENQNLIVAVDKQHLIKISYKSNVFEYQAASKVKGVWYCSDTNELILVELNQKIKVWKIASSLVDDLIQTNGNCDDPLDGKSAMVRCCDFSSTNYLAVATSNMAKMFNLVDRRNVAPLSFNQSVNCCGFSPDGQSIAFGFADGAIQMYDVELQLLRETRVTSSVKTVCIGNGARVFGALSSQRIHVGRWQAGVANLRIACTELHAKQLIKAANHHRDCFITIDKRSQTIYKVTFFNSRQFTNSNSLQLAEPFSALNINSTPPTRPRLHIKRKQQLFKDNL